MAKRSSTSQWLTPVSSLLLPRSGDALWYTLSLLSLSSLLLHHLSLPTYAVTPSPHFEGFGDDLDDPLDDSPIQLTDLPPSPTLTQSDSQTHHGPPPSSSSSDLQSQFTDSPPSRKPSSQFEYWDEDEFEGLPTDFQQSLPESPKVSDDTTPSENNKEVASSLSDAKPQFVADPKSLIAVYAIEIACVSFLIVFGINYFTGKKENENLALAWAAKFATKDTIFEKNFSLLGVGEGEDSPLLLKEGQNVFKFYASGRRYCQGLLATLELKSRHDLISRVYNAVVPTKDEITFEVYMNDEAIDQVVFAVARKKTAKTMLKEFPDLQRFGSLMPPPSNKKWVAEDLSVVSESKEVGADLITEVVLDQV